MRLPKDKSDIASILELECLSNDELRPLIPELLEWLRDINWPIASPIARLLSKRGEEIVEPIRSILRGSDAVWKKWVISELLVHCDSGVRIGLEDEILRILNSPTDDEINEGVIESARDAFFLLCYNDQQKA